MAFRLRNTGSGLATAVAVALIGALGLLMLQGRHLVERLRSSLTVVVELRPNATQSEVQGTLSWIESQAFAKTASARHVSREEGAEALRASYGEELLDFGLDNPLYDVITFQLAADALNEAGPQALEQRLEARSSVQSAYVQEDLFAALSARLRQLAWGAGILAFLLVGGVVYLTLTTTRLALLARAPLIRNMQLVGASWSYITRPYLRRAALSGLAAGALGIALVSAVGAFAERLLPAVWLRPSAAELSLLAIGILSLAVTLQVGGTYRVLRQTLKMRVDDLALLQGR